MNNSIAIINKKFVEACGNIEDGELDDLIKFYTDLCEMVDCLGMEFNLQKAELHIRRERLFSFQRERNIKS